VFGVELSEQFEPSDSTPAPLVLMRCTAELEKRIRETGKETSVGRLKSVRHTMNGFWATVCKTVCPVLSDHSWSALSVCDVDVLRPNGWIDSDATWCGGSSLI